MTTNVLDGLLARIEDPDLRLALTSEVALLRGTRQFGLVFERHFPENVCLYSHPISRGARVQLKDSSTDKSWLVTALKDGQATLLSEEGHSESKKVEDLVVIREFGEPVYPGIKQLGAIQKGGNKREHIVLKAENHHALQALLYLYEGQVDCIYIDPPFNSGARDWKYNNNYVADDDAYRHSKWLSFMDKRLRLAKRLLNPADAVLIVAIDENEVHRLTLLLEQLFPASKIQMVTALINPAGASIIDQFSRVDEQMLFVHIGTARPQRTVAETTPLYLTKEPNEEGDVPARKKGFVWESVQRSGGNSRRQDTKAKFFPIYIDEKKERIVGCGDHLPEGEDRRNAPRAPKGCIQQWPIKTDGSEACWQLSAPTFREYLKVGRIRLGRKKDNGAWGISFLTKGHMKAIAAGELVVNGKDEQGALIVTNAQNRERTRVGKTIWINGCYSATEHGSTLLRRFIPGRKFPFPKSLYAVEDALRFYVAHKPNALIVDFFAGSGTTAHAVARLNRQDGGRRTCISITNNEVSVEEAALLRARGLRPGDAEWEGHGIFEFITRPRIEAAIAGRTPEGKSIEGEYRFVDPFPMADGFDENVRFFELSYLDRNEVSRGRAFESIAALLWMKAGAAGKMIEKQTKRFAAPEEARYAILFDLKFWHEFAEAVRARTDLTHIFVVTDSLAQYQQVVAELPATVEVSMLYEDYLRNFEINVGGGL